MHISDLDILYLFALHLPTLQDGSVLIHPIPPGVVAKVADLCQLPYETVWDEVFVFVINAANGPPCVDRQGGDFLRRVLVAGATDLCCFRPSGLASDCTHCGKSYRYSGGSFRHKVQADLEGRTVDHVFPTNP